MAKVGGRVANTSTYLFTNDSSIGSMTIIISLICDYIDFLSFCL